MTTTLSLLDIAALSPLLALLAGGMLVLLLESFGGEKAKQWSGHVTLVALIGALVAVYYAPASDNVLLTPWLHFDSLARLFTVFFLLIGIGSTLLSASFFDKFGASRGEYHFLLISALFGLILIGCAANFLTLFLGIETLSISLYVLCGYMKKWEISHEAAVKYFLMGSLAAAFLLYGIALIYGAIGTTSLGSLMSSYQGLEGSSKVLFLAGIALVTLALAFEAAIVPFQIWAPDVYEGAPTPVTAFMSVGTKVGAFAAFIRIFIDALPHFDPMWNQGVALLVYPTLIFGNLLAIKQVQLRRFFAYSGISHAGFLLIPMAVGTQEAVPALLFYLVVYAIATLGAFAVFAFLDCRKEGVVLADLQGLFKKSPWLAVILSFCFLTLAGIPPTIGFFAKFYLFKLAFQAGYYGLVVLGLLTSVLAAYYYLRIVAIMFSEEPAEERSVVNAWPATVVGVLSLALIIFLSLFPTPLLTYLTAMSNVQ